ncbi:MAG: ATP-dependent DNA helicase RecQ [Acidobacteria bacterium]|nr:ATP-dependent DNA helicase RecQ [Acidobacteriota bacterium]MBA3886615.1 ATP-dependent DNA helicase RecQ [Acidobacteriota bacterium]
MTITCESPTDLLATLHRHFGHRAFRPGQEQLVAAVLRGRDVLAVMPTGSGKSLGYQLPAVVLPGTTLVVSPLISLMKDQVDELNRRGIPSGALHSMLSSECRREVIEGARAAHLRLLYVAPERFASDQFIRLLGELTIARFVIDEAHCVSEWGHDFRPDYRRLRSAAAACRTIDGAVRPPIAAFTATATREVRDDIVALLGLEAPQILVAGFDRPNIYLRVEPVLDEDEKHERLPRLVTGRRALVYAATRRSAEAAATTLQAGGLQAAAYHAGLEDRERTRVQDAFASGALGVVCATNAFGMGIDRPDVDAVVHFAIPGSVEAYYQEIGRAGRDGRRATATLLWDYADVATREFLIDAPRRAAAGAPRGARPPVDPAELARRKEIEHRRLQRMIAYAGTNACLRATILQYFGDPDVRQPCHACSNCQPHALDAYECALVRTILTGIAQAGERYGRRRIAAMLAGDVDDLPPTLADVPSAGSLAQEQAYTVGQWIDAAISSGLIVTSQDQYRTLSLTARGRDVMTGRTGDLQMASPVRPADRWSRRRLRGVRHGRSRRKQL